jgi:hypothetical protein
VAAVAAAAADAVLTSEYRNIGTCVNVYFGEEPFDMKAKNVEDIPVCHLSLLHIFAWSARDCYPWQRCETIPMHASHKQCIERNCGV